ncbi:endospore germination permease [Paenibacillus sp. JX-17]|uniref:Endospore germination permease n=1 Tax=Paenibacillus lacisoli TaxID=3064525 RepID=A0ABT9CFI7_9BACL|nr:endospore germination permease [Paenibacillus sp. JX-17]MDO7906446.1 endospore germination permease [Paenibacillus sp. JX-17]
MDRITNRQVVLLGAMMESTITLIHAHAQIAESARQHAYLSYVPVILLLGMSVWLLSAVHRRFPGQDVFQIMSGRFPLVGRVIIVLYMIFTLFILGRDLRMLTDYVNVTLLPTTPMVIVAGCFAFTTVFMVKGGLRSLIGMVEIYMPVLIFVLLTMPVVLGRTMDLGLIKPFNHLNWQGIGEGSWNLFAYAGDMIMLPFVLSGNAYSRKAGWGGLALGTALLVLLLMLTLMELGIPITSRLLYPSYELSRQLQLTDFLDRFDLIISAITSPVFITKVGFDLYVLCVALKRLLPGISGQVMASPLGLMGFVCSFCCYKNVMQLFHFSRTWTLFVLLFHVLLPLLLFLFLHPRHKAPAS